MLDFFFYLISGQISFRFQCRNLDASPILDTSQKEGDLMKEGKCNKEFENIILFHPNNIS